MEGGKKGRERKRRGIGSDSEVKKGQERRNGGEEDGGDGDGGEEAKRADRVTQRG